MKKMIAFAMVALLALPVAATAQTMAISADQGGTLTQVFDTPVGTPFNIVVWGSTGGRDVAASEFVASELLLLYPGVFKLGTVKINNTTLDLGDNSLGEYILAFGACFPPSDTLEMVRVQYGDFSGIIGSDVVMSLRGFQPGDTRPSSFNGSVGYVDCQDVKYAATVGGTDGGFTGGGVTFPDGSLILNGTPAVVDTQDESISQLKARF
jgi:hypothetical protein